MTLLITESEVASFTGATVADGIQVSETAVSRDGPTTELDGDPAYEDVNGDGRLDYDGVVTLFEEVN